MELQQQPFVSNVVSKTDLTGNLFTQVDDSNKNDSKFYNEVDLKSIVNIIEKTGIFSDFKTEKIVTRAILNYLPKRGGFQYILMEKIVILQNQLNLSEKVVSQLKSIILKAKK